MKTVMCVVALAGFAGVASAAWSRTSRTSNVFARGDDAPIAQVTSTTMMPFNESIQSIGSSGTAKSSQNSALTSTGVTVSNYAEASSYARPWSGGGYGSGNGDSEFKLVFNVTSVMDYTLKGRLYGFPAGRVTLKNLATNQFLVNFKPFDPASFDYSGTIGPGNYQLDVLVNVSGGAGSSWFTGVDATWTLIPAPSATAVFGLFGFVATRRRR